MRRVRRIDGSDWFYLRSETEWNPNHPYRCYSVRFPDCERIEAEAVTRLEALSAFQRPDEAVCGRRAELVPHSADPICRVGSGTKFLEAAAEFQPGRWTESSTAPEQRSGQAESDGWSNPVAAGGADSRRKRCTNNKIRMAAGRWKHRWQWLEVLQVFRPE